MRLPPSESQNEKEPGCHRALFICGCSSSELPHSLPGQGTAQHDRLGELGDDRPMRGDLANMRHDLQRAGWSLVVVDDGHGEAALMVSRWGRSRVLPDRRALLVFMRQVGVRA